MNKIDKSILIGMILGDGYLQKGKNSSTLKIEHSTQQLEYLKYKRELLIKIFGGKHPDIHIRSRVDSRNNHTYHQCWLSKTEKYLKILRDRIYLNGKKEYTEAILKKLTPEGLAIWYMDDGGNGSIYISKKTGKISSCVTYLCTDCSFEQASIIRDYFKNTYDVEFKLYNIRKDQYRLCANTSNSRKFVELIRPYIIPEMQYKIRHVPINLHEIQTSKDEDIV